MEETCRVIKQNTDQEKLSGESGVEGNGSVEEQHLEDKILSRQFRWMSRTHRSEPAVETCSVAESSVDNNSRNSEIDTY